MRKVTASLKTAQLKESDESWLPKVVREAIENAVSVASVLLLAEATLTKLPEEKKKAAAAYESFE